MRYKYVEKPRAGDHICYISDLHGSNGASRLEHHQIARRYFCRDREHLGGPACDVAVDAEKEDRRAQRGPVPSLDVPAQAA